MKMQELFCSHLVLLAYGKWLQHHAAVEDPPRVWHELVGSQVEMVKEISNHREEGESKARLEHGLVQTDLLAI